jgi:Flavin containing amine oxidoreductase/HMG (high mobility group) box
MAGASAHLAEQTDNDALVAEVTARLATVFAHRTVPHPREVVVTRWKRDPFARGSYSFVAPGTMPDDYDTMARAIGAVHFAGEATCGTHPATVHGAYISGLRAAAEVVDALLGPQAVPAGAGEPLVAPKVGPGAPPRAKKRKRAGGYIDVWEPVDGADGASVSGGNILSAAAEEKERLAAEREGRLQAAIVAALGPRPAGPPRGRLNPYILYVSKYWERGRRECDEARTKKQGGAAGKGGDVRHEVRTRLGAEWKALSEEGKKPYLDRCAEGRRKAEEAVAAYAVALQEWDEKAAKVRAEFVEEGEVPKEAVKVEGAKEAEQEVAAAE